MTLHSLEVHGGEEIDGAFARAADARDDAVLALPGPVTVVNKERIVALALKYRLPSMFHLPEFVRSGGLLSYGPDRADLFRRAAIYVDKILKGENAGDLPVEQATKFQLVVNLRTAKALGMRVPREVLAYTDEIIE
jgi:putative ABC transport system substrate-binding protein